MANLSTTRSNPSRLPAIEGVKYTNSRWPGLGLETMLLSDLRTRAPKAHFSRPQRPGFHVLFLCVSGRGRHRLDFVDLDLAPGTVIHVQPRQVQQFDLQATTEAHVVVFAPEFPGREPGEPAWPSRLVLGPEDRGTIEATFRDLHREYQRTDGSALSVRLLQHLLQVLLLRLRRIPAVRVPLPAASASGTLVFQLLRQEVERSFAKTRSIGDYAQRLGYSARTLSRASISLAGVTAKELVDDRVLLEGKRLLAHSDLSVGQIAYRLGFNEATNFAKFFRNRAGTGPVAFRESLHT